MKRSELEAVGLPPTRKGYNAMVDGFLRAYEGATWLRALVQTLPGGSSIDVILAGRATSVNQRRLIELIDNVEKRVSKLATTELDKAFLETDEFFEVFRATAEIAAHSANEQKRAVLADYLAGIVEAGELTDLRAQVLEDLRSLQPIHLRVLASLPREVNKAVSRRIPSGDVSNMPPAVYEKAMSDLERFGFLRYNTAGIGTYGGGSGHWETTDYVGVFLESVSGASS